MKNRKRIKQARAWVAGQVIDMAFRVDHRTTRRIMLDTSDAYLKAHAHLRAMREYGFHVKDGGAGLMVDWGDLSDWTKTPNVEECQSPSANPNSPFGI